MKLRSNILALLFVESVFFSSCKVRNFLESDIRATDLVNSSSDRHRVIAEANVWGSSWEDYPTAAALQAADEALILKVSNRDILAGPQHVYWNRLGNKSLTEVECTFDETIVNVKTPPGGRTAKFGCLTEGAKKSTKIKYDPVYSSPYPDVVTNDGVYGEVLATRLMWALGFPTDSIYPTEVRCKNCPIDPWLYLKKQSNSLDSRDFVFKQISRTVLDKGEVDKRSSIRVFFPSVVEVPAPGREMTFLKTKLMKSPFRNEDLEEGWSFDEITDSRNFSSNLPKAARQKVHREALVLLMSFLMHSDSKAENQRISCIDDLEEIKETKGLSCKRALLVVHDPGAVFGIGLAPVTNLLKGRKIAAHMKISPEEWKKVSMWQNGNSENCIVKVNRYIDGTLSKQKISPAGINFFVQLMSELSDEQVRNLIKASKVEFAPNGAKRIVFTPDHQSYTVENRSEGLTEDDWYNAFQEKKVRDIINHRCGK